MARGPPASTGPPASLPQLPGPDQPCKTLLGAGRRGPGLQAIPVVSWAGQLQQAWAATQQTHEWEAGPSRRPSSWLQLTLVSGQQGWTDNRDGKNGPWPDSGKVQGLGPSPLCQH